MTRDFAETIGMQALAWLAGHDDLLPVFLGTTGATLEEVRTRAAEPELLTGVLDFLCLDDAWISGFCASAGLRPEQPSQAREVLAGPAGMHWT